jgi:hypothetical protein
MFVPPFAKNHSLIVAATLVGRVSQWRVHVRIDRRPAISS